MPRRSLAKPESLQARNHIGSDKGGPVTRYFGGFSIYGFILALAFGLLTCSPLTEDCETGSWLVSLTLMIGSDADVKPVLSELGKPYPRRIKTAEQAREYLLRKAVECSCLRKTNADCLLGAALIDEGCDEEAISYLLQCVERSPNGDGYLGLAEAYSRIGDSESAQKYRRKADAIKGEWD